jgi:predicted RND superfamily exporter protein
MNRLRQRIEIGFEALAGKIFQYRIRTLLLLGSIISALMTQLPCITVDTSMEGFLHPDDPALVAYNEFRSQFGRDEMIIIGFQCDNVFDESFLNTLKNIHHELEEKVPYLDEVTSLINARNTSGHRDELIVKDLLEEWPNTAQAMAHVRQRALANHMYRNILLSEDGRFTTIIVRTNAFSSQSTNTEKDLLQGFDNMSPDEGSALPAKTTYLTDAENTEVVEAVDAVVQKYKAMGHKIHLAGTTVVTHI